MKSLYFFSYSYPFSNVFSWKRNELNELARFFKVRIIPYWKLRELDTAQFNDEIQIEEPILKERVDIGFLSLVRFLLSPRALYYMHEFFSKRVFLGKIRFLKWLIASAETEELLKNKVIRDLMAQNPGNNESILYFYWGLGNTLLVPFLRKKGYKKIFVRFHGFDLYEERNEGYIPYRTAMLKNIDCAIFISEQGQKYLHDRYSKINFDSKIFRLGCYWYGNSDASTDGKLRLVSCSNVIPLKRVDYILEALKEIEFQVEWIHFGDGEKFDELREVCKYLPENIQVKLPGRVTPEEIMEHYITNPVDLFINVSTTEGVPVSIMEALSAGIPILATDVGGTSELVNETNGILLDKDIIPSQLADEVKKFHELDGKERLKLRNAAAETFQKKCNFQRLSADFIDFLNSEI